MSLKSIKANYTKFLGALNEAGVKINESQKETLDNFMLAIENKITKTRDEAIRATKRIVEDKLEKEYKQVVESIIKHQKDVNEISGKIQNKVTQVNESKKLSEAVDEYLSQYVEEVLPKKTLVDYERMEKLERIHESLKDMLLVNDSAVLEKAEELKGNLVKENQELKTECDNLKKKIDETEKKSCEMTEQLEEAKAKEFVANKVKDLPVAESEKVIKKCQGKKVEDLEKNFKQILEEVQNEISEEKEISNDETNLEEAIKGILEGEEQKKAEENTEKICNKDVEGQDVSQDENMEEIFEEESNDDSVQVNESMMQSWINTLYRITPQK